MAFSTSQEIRLPLRWIAVLRSQAPISLAASSGVHHPLDGVKLLLAGADVVTTAAALLERGPHYLMTLRDGLRGWMIEHEYASVRQMRGSMSYANCPDPTGYERANYMRVLTSYTGSGDWR
jgi:dihydroorotate dehydrogenase (fumarate)